jgi:hypothetical protein
LCVDFNKAFDSVEHACIESVLKFFNFGDRMIGMVKTILRNRQARVKVEDGLSDPFNIERSTPQGDRASPYIFILVIEILIIKLIAKSNNGIETCRYMQEIAYNASLEIGTAEAYADDLTILFKLTEGSLGVILNILTEFEALSGLSINKNKTQLMACGTERYAEGEELLGIKIVKEINVLGLIIDKELRQLDQNWEKVIAKVIRLCNYWKVFRLSIAGRVMIINMFLLSQCVYLMNTLELKPEIGERLNEIFINYAKGTDRPLSRDNRFNKAELGGYGLIDINILNTSIKASWIVRWQKEREWQDYPSFYATGRNVTNVEQVMMEMELPRPLLLTY